MADEKEINFKLLNSDFNQVTPGRYTFDKDSHVSVLLHNIRELWADDKLIDISLTCRDSKNAYNFHMIQLAGYSNMFRESFCHGNFQILSGTAIGVDVPLEMLEMFQQLLYQPALFNTSKESIQADGQNILDFAILFGLEEQGVEGFDDKEKILSNWRMMFEQRRLTFTWLVTDDAEVPCHGLLLAALSPVFRSQLMQSQADDTSTCLLKGGNKQVCLQIVTFLYEGEVTMDATSVCDLLLVACQLRLLSLVRACTHFMSAHVEPGSAVQYLEIARESYKTAMDPQCKQLQALLDHYIVTNFIEVVKSDKFQQSVVYDEIVKYLIKATLTPDDHDIVTESLMSWFLNDTTARRKPVSLLLTLVNSLLIPSEIGRLIGVAATNGHPQLKPVALVFLNPPKTQKDEKQHDKKKIDVKRM